MELPIVTILLEHGADETTSGNLMCQDLKRTMEPWGYQVNVVKTLKEASETHPDLLINSCPKEIINVAKAAGRYFYCGRLITLFTPAMGSFHEPEIAYMVMSAADTPLICHSPWIYHDFQNHARRLLNASTFRRVMQNVHLIPYGVLDKFSFTRKSGEALNRFIAPFTRVTREYKRYHVHKPTTEKVSALFAMRGLQMQNVLYYASKRWAHIEDNDMSGYELRPVIVDRDQYAAELQQFGFSISTSDEESFGLYYVELLLSGIVVIFADFPWIRRLLPNYRFVCRDSELPLMALWCREHYDEAFAHLEQDVIPYIRQNYLIESFARKLVQQFCQDLPVRTRNA